MEIASGDYGSDLTKVMASAVEKQCNETFNGGILIDEHLAVTEGEILIINNFFGFQINNS